MVDLKGVAFVAPFYVPEYIKRAASKLKICVIYGGREYGFIYHVSVGSRFVNGCFCCGNL